MQLRISRQQRITVSFSSATDEYSSLENGFFDKPLLACGEKQTFKREHDGRFDVVHDVICIALEVDNATSASSLCVNDTSCHETKKDVETLMSR